MSEDIIDDLGDLSKTKNSMFTLIPHMKEISSRALSYLNAGFPVHLKGPAGVGKTVLASYIAHILGKPATVIFGNEGMNTSDIVGLQYGYRKKMVEDNFIHSVHKKTEDYEQKWIDGRIINACESGHTLIYDEFTRSKPETNNILLSVFEEKVLELPVNYIGENKLIKVHPEFKAIFTSNPEEYAGVYKTQYALLDRFITIEIDFPDKKGEISIASSNSGLPTHEVEVLISIVRSFREKFRNSFVVSLRDSIKLCKVVKQNSISIDLNNDQFRQICFDILTSGIGVQKSDVSKEEIKSELNYILKYYLTKLK